MITSGEFINILSSKLSLLPQSGIVIIAAHPDDEILAAGGILPFIKDSLSIITVTDGSPKNLNDAIRCGFTSREAYCAARYTEQSDALDLVDFDSCRCYRIGLTDQETSYNLPGLSYIIKDYIQMIKPALILTHAFEGGHPDHDAVSFSVWAASVLLKNSGMPVPLIMEFPTYHGDGISERMVFDFIPYNNSSAWGVELNQHEITLKRAMVDCFKTQLNTISSFPLEKESFRLAPQYDFSSSPHQGVLLYEFYDWGMSVKDWLVLSTGARRLMGLEQNI